MNTVSRRELLGARIARALSGAWRPDPPGQDEARLPAEDLESIAPHLLGTGAGGLGWWNSPGVRDRASAASSETPGAAGETRGAAAPLHDAFRLQTLDARLHERRLLRALEVLGSVDVHPVLAKGWAVAREYPRPGLRPYGDHDLHVAPHEFDRATAALAAAEREAGSELLGEANLRVDLHPGVPRLARDWDVLAARCAEVSLEGHTVRILGHADHLELLSAHFLAHGAWRPLWLCDIALFVEAHGTAMDWEAWAGGPDSGHGRGRFVRECVLLAHELLGAHLGATPWAEGFSPLPRWLPRGTLCAWGVGGHYSLTTSITLEDATPRALLRSARIRWPNPIEATVRWSRPFDSTPRLPYQLLDVLARGWRAVFSAPAR